MKAVITNILKSNNFNDAINIQINGVSITISMNQFEALFPCMRYRIGTSFEYQITFVQPFSSQTVGPAPVSSRDGGLYKAICSEVDRIQQSIASRNPGLEPVPVPACNCLQINGHAAWCNVEGV